MNTFISISGMDTVINRLKKLPKEAQNEGVEEANKYMVNIMQKYPPKSSEPFQWSSDKQRKAVMAKLREQGQTHYSRTQELRRGWKTKGKGVNQIVENLIPYTQFVQDRNQIQGHRARGWMTVNTMLNDKGKEILKKFDAGVKKAIKKLKFN
jgi:hypothetical protein